MKPRYLTPKYALSNLSWQDGLMPYFIDHVPFSHSTGNPLARGIAKLIHAIAYGSFHFIEMGGGMGLFARQLLDVIAKDYPDIYSNFLYTFSDSSSWLKDPHFESIIGPHHTRLDIVHDPASEVLAEKKADMIYLSYLIDSFNTAQFQIIEGEIFEILIESTISQSTILWNVDTFPPTKETVSDFNTRLTTLSSQSPAMRRRLSAALIETTHLIPLSQSKVSKIDQTSIRDYVATYQLKNGILNIPLRLDLLWEQLGKNLLPEGMVVIHDFGADSPNGLFSLSDLTVTYGPILAFPLCFSYLEFVAKKSGFRFHSYSKDPENSGVKLGVFTRDSHALARIAPIFSTLFHPSYLADIRAVNELVLVNNAPEAQFQNALKLRNVFPNEYKNYFSLTEHLSNLAIQTKRLELPLTLLSDLDECYQIFGISMMLLCARAYLAQGELLRAENLLIRALHYCPRYAPALFDLGFLYVSQNRFEAAIHAIILSIQESDQDLPYDRILSVGMCYVYAKKIEKGRRIFEWLCNTSDAIPGEIPQDLYSQAKAFLKSVM